MRLALASAAESGAHLRQQKKEKSRSRHEDMLLVTLEKTRMSAKDAAGRCIRAYAKEKVAEETLQKATQAAEECIRQLRSMTGC